MISYDGIVYASLETRVTRCCNGTTEYATRAGSFKIT